ncbi:hypothetical protein H8I69_20975 [Serratia fonticola]|uniref:hypothetical protein n=1 Tax=Serratia fonticola TaxID=47917 RepID=UPI0015C5E2DA|nr:hypothetical protein [Serratia fonticola]MBC3381594.1 hypothetical protein [Serratia fonticola]NYA40793.1 hypothetical protein [Serratia fonticola]
MPRNNNATFWSMLSVIMAMIITIVNILWTTGYDIYRDTQETKNIKTAFYIEANKNKIPFVALDKFKITLTHTEPTGDNYALNKILIIGSEAISDDVYNNYIGKIDKLSPKDAYDIIALHSAYKIFVNAASEFKSETQNDIIKTATYNTDIIDAYILYKELNESLLKNFGDN